MAIVKCPECQHEISDAARSCPHCGCPLKGGHFKLIGALALGAVVAIALAAAMIVAIRGRGGRLDEIERASYTLLTGGEDGSVTIALPDEQKKKIAVVDEGGRLVKGARVMSAPGEEGIALFVRDETQDYAPQLRYVPSERLTAFDKVELEQRDQWQVQGDNPQAPLYRRSTQVYSDLSSEQAEDFTRTLGELDKRDPSWTRKESSDMGRVTPVRYATTVVGIGDGRVVVETTEFATKTGLAALIEGAVLTGQFDGWTEMVNEREDVSIYLPHEPKGSFGSVEVLVGQEAEGSWFGSDEGLAGIPVVVTGHHNPAGTQVTTDAEGRAFFAQVEPGPQQVRVEGHGAFAVRPNTQEAIEGQDYSVGEAAFMYYAPISGDIEVKKADITPVEIKVEPQLVEEELDDVRLLWREKGTSTWESQTLRKPQAGVYDLTLPRQDIRSGETEFSVVASAGDRKAYSPALSFVVEAKREQLTRIEQADKREQASAPLSAEVKKASFRLSRKLDGHSRTVTCVAFSPDGKRIVSGSNDKSLRVWSSLTGRCLGSVERLLGAVWASAFSPDGALIAAGGDYEDPKIRLWDSASLSLLFPEVLEGHTGAINCVAFSPNGTLLASGSTDETIRLWDLTSRAHVISLKGHDQSVCSVAFSPDGKLVFSGSRDDTVKVWDVQTSRCLATLKGHSGDVCSVACSSDGRFVASGSSDSTVRLWDIQSGVCVKTLVGHSFTVHSTSLSHDGQLLLSGSIDGSLKLWDVGTGLCLATLEAHSHKAALSPSGELIASGSRDGTLAIWGSAQEVAAGENDDLAGTYSSPNGELQIQLTNISNAGAKDDRPKMSADGNRVVFESYRDGNDEVYLYDGETGILKNISNHKASDTSPVISANGLKVAFTSDRGQRKIHMIDDRVYDTVHVVELESMSVRELGKLVFGKHGISPDGKIVTFVSSYAPGRNMFERTKIVCLSDVTVGVQTIVREGGRYVHISDNGWLVASDGSDVAMTREAVGVSLIRVPEAPSKCSVSADGTRVVFCRGLLTIEGLLEQVYFFDTRKKSLAEISYKGTSPRISGDGNYVVFQSDVSGNNEIYVVNLENRSVTNVSNHEASDTSPSISAGGRKVTFVSERDGNKEIYFADLGRPAD